MPRVNFAYCVLALALPLALSGCAGALLVGGLAGAAGGGYAAAQERGAGGALSDLQIEADMDAAFANAGPGLKEGITTDSYQGRVLLAGQVATPEMKARATQVASRVAGVRALYDEIEVGSPRGAWDVANDAWITARLRSELVLDPDIRSGNYTIEAANGSVYLIGSARSQEELNRAIGAARYIPGVKRVVSYVELRSGAPIAQEPTAPAAATGPSRSSAALPPPKS